MTRKPRPRIKQQKTKCWNLEKDEYKLNFLPKAQEILASVKPEMNYEELEADILRLAKEELGETSGGGQFIEKETWWWNQQVKGATKLRKIPLRSGNLAERNKIVSSIKSRKISQKSGSYCQRERL